MTKVSVFRTALSTEPINTDVSTILSHIRDGYWEKKIVALRSMEKEQYDINKRYLPAVTFSGTFTKRENAGLDIYSGIICLDIDSLGAEQVINLKNQFTQDSLIYACFISPSGKGLKILVKVNTGAEHHLSAFLHLQEIFETKYCFKIDDSGKDVARLCFISCDSELILNESSQIFEVDVRYGEVKKYVVPANLQNYKPVVDTKRIFDLCVSWVERTCTYVQGQRNRFIHSLACACNRVGLGITVTEKHIKEAYDLDHKEIEHCIKSAYFKNQSEHGSVEVKDIGLQEFKAPPWVMNYNDDVVVSDIMQTTCMLHSYKVPHDQIFHIMKLIGVHYHNKGYIDLKRNSLAKIMNDALSALNSKVAEESDRNTLQYVNAEEIVSDLIDLDFDNRAIPTSFLEIDKALRGGLQPGNFYGIIGVGGTFKSILAQFLAVITAYSGKGVLYINAEMSRGQFYERLALMTMNVKLHELLSNKKLNKETLPGFIKEMNAVLHNNLMFVQGDSFSEENIQATITNIKAKHDKRIDLIVIDGITQMSSNGLAEIPAAIHNTAICKKIAKESNDGEGVVVLGLMHISGENDKLFRDTGLRCRGGIKTVSAMDGYFSTSLLADESNNSLDKQGTEIDYIESKFYLKMVDKRGAGGITNAIIDVHDDLRLSLRTTNVGAYEIKITKQNTR